MPFQNHKDKLRALGIVAETVPPASCRETLRESPENDLFSGLAGGKQPHLDFTVHLIGAGGIRQLVALEFLATPVGQGLLVEDSVGISHGKVRSRRGFPAKDSKELNKVSTILGSASTSSSAVRAGQVV